MRFARPAQVAVGGSLLALALWATSRALAPAHVVATASTPGESEGHGSTTPADRRGDGASEATATATATSPRPVSTAVAAPGAMGVHPDSVGARAEGVANGGPGRATQPAVVAATEPAVRLSDAEHDEPVPEHILRAMSRVAGNPSGSPFGEMGCERQQAFAAGALRFSEPTPEALRAPLEAATRGGHSISLVLRKSGDDFLASLGATLPGPDGKEAFAAGKPPSSVLLVPAFGEPPGISSNEVIERASLLVSKGKAPVVLELRSLVWRASKDGSCDRLSVDVRGQLPLSQYTLPIPGPAGSTTIAELLGVAVPPGGFPATDRPSPGLPATGQVYPASIHFTFEAKPSTFDFGTP